MKAIDRVLASSCFLGGEAFLYGRLRVSADRSALLGAINLNDIGSTYVERVEAVNSESIQQFLTQLRDNEDSNRVLHLVLDGAAYHRANAVKDKAKSLNIELHYLPPYSPNLNPIERLWKVMNEHARNNKYFESAKAFRSAIDNFLQTRYLRLQTLWRPELMIIFRC